MSKMKLIIAGGRHFNDYARLKKVCDQMTVNFKDIEVVSGCARGADSLGKRWAKERGYDVVKFPAKWDEFGKSAGYIRNKQMAEYGTHLIAFWDGVSKGTNHMIQLAEKAGLKVRIVLYT